MEQRPAAGHRSVPHTADLRLEAWAATREECIAEAVLALVEGFADISRARAAHLPGRTVKHRLAGQADADLVAAALEEVIYGLDTRGQIPVGVSVRRATDGGIELMLSVISLDEVEVTGAAPKAVSLSGLRCAQEPTGHWACAVTIDV